MTFEFKPAVREGMPALIALWGPSSSGKTYTALQIARGLVGPQGKIGLIDTENRRAKFYSALAGGWHHLDLQPPFTPERYAGAANAAADAGFDCVIIDSTSHVWSGEGGVLEAADKIGGNGLNKWRVPKTAYNRMLGTLWRSPIHIIFCLRAKDAVKQIGKGKDATVESVGAQPICGAGFLYEMTVAALLGPDHCPAFPGPRETVHCDPLIPALKAPEDLRHIFQPGKPLGIETGQMIAAWVSGGVAVDHDFERQATLLRDAAALGNAALVAHWKALARDWQARLVNVKDEAKQIAADADRVAAENRDPDEEDPFDNSTDAGKTEDAPASMLIPLIAAGRSHDWQRWRTDMLKAIKEVQENSTLADLTQLDADNRDNLEKCPQVRIADDVKGAFAVAQAEFFKGAA
jgi:hypothetical protein